jgi:hypothetical protein
VDGRALLKKHFDETRLTAAAASTTMADGTVPADG